jgi:hypothetical protein
VEHADGSVHHGPATRGGGVLAVAQLPAASRHGGLLAVVGDGEGSTGTSFRSSPWLGRWCGGGSSEGTTQRRSMSEGGALELRERRRVEVSAVMAGGSARPFIGLRRGGEAVVRGGDGAAVVVEASMPSVSARVEEMERWRIDGVAPTWERRGGGR